MSVVLDNSVAIAWIDHEEPAIDPTFETRVREEGALVPALFYAEFSNALLTRVRRDRFSTNDVQRALDYLRTLPVTMSDDQPSATNLAFIGKTCKLTGYDAWYLYLAVQYDLPLATRDEALKEAAHSLGVELIGT